MLVGLTKPFSPFQGGSSSAFSFHPSLLQEINAVMLWDFCPQLVFQTLEHFSSCLPVHTPICPGLYVHWSLRRWLLKLSHASLGFPVHRQQPFLYWLASEEWSPRRSSHHCHQQPHPRSTLHRRPAAVCPLRETSDLEGDPVLLESHFAVGQCAW